MSTNIQQPAPGAARCPGVPSVQELVRANGVAVPDVLGAENYEFLGDEDIPFERYTSQAFFDREMQLMWSRVWQWACREEQIPEVGDAYTYDIGKWSILIVRTADGVKAYWNSCLHRGTRFRGAEGESHAPDLRCPYHGWTWSLDGRLVDLPCRWDFPHVKDEDFRLPEVKVGLWGGFVFINMDEHAEPLEKFLEVLPEHFQRWPFEDRYIAVWSQKELPCNWKLAQEAFIESYHVPVTHPELVNTTSDTNCEYDIYGNNVSRFWAALGVQGPNAERQFSEQELLDLMLSDARSATGAKVELRPGETARMAVARHLRATLAEAYRTSLDHYTDTEIVDTIEYHLFPNMVLFPALSLPMAYRFRPIGQSPDRCLYEILILRPLPDGEPRPEPVLPTRVTAEQSYAVVPGMDPGIAYVLDQDTNNLRSQQLGMETAKKRGQTLANYQEIRLRHQHRTLDRYLRGERS
jgi:phenylpropionate dioxygenase-like ring-hydroxylating dioxygenase large terminal subunit